MTLDHRWPTTTPLDGLGITLCSLESAAPQPEPGNVVHAKAYLTAFVPQIWRQTVAAAPQAVVPPIDRVDSLLEPLTMAQRYLMHLMLEESMDEVGLRWSYDCGDFYELDGGARAGLSGLARILAQEPWEDWCPVIDERVRGFVEMLAGRDDEIDRGRLYPRLRLREPNAETRDGYPITTLIEGLELLLAVDNPHTVTMLTEPGCLAELGGVAELLAVAMANLKTLPTPQPAVVSLGGDDADEPLVVHVFETEDYFGASRLLRLPELVHEMIGAAPNGVLAAIPDRQCLLVMILGDGPALNAVNRYACVVQDIYDSTGGPVSPQVYVQSGDGPVEPVAHIQGDSSLYARATGRFDMDRLVCAEVDDG